MSNSIPYKLANSSMPQLLELYNLAAARLGRPVVKRFSDRAAAEKRTAAILAESPAPAGPVADASGETPDLGGVSPGKVEPVGGEAKKERLKSASKVALAEKPTPAATGTPKTKPGAGLPVASKDPAKDAEMPTLRRALKPVELAPKPKVYPRKAGSKQALLVDLLSRPEGATFGELYDALAAGGKPWKGVTIRSGLAWDMNHIAGYGVTSEALNAEQFARTGRTYEAHRLGYGTDAEDHSFKLLVYRLAYPKGMTAPLPHTPRAGPSAEQKAAASAAMAAELKAAVDAKKAQA